MVTNLDRALAERERSLSGAPSGRAFAYYAIGLATKYLLTGEKKYADQTRDAVQTIMDFDQLVTINEMRRGCILTGVAIPYDVCYDAWDPGFRGGRSTARTIPRRTVTITPGAAVARACWPWQCSPSRLAGRSRSATCNLWAT